MTSAELTSIIVSGNYPASVNLFQQDRIKELYDSGKTWQAIRKLQSILEKPIGGKSKTLL